MKQSKMMRIHALFQITITLLLALFASGCSLAPAYIPPEIDLPGSFEKATTDETGQQNKRSSYEEVNREWWSSLNSKALLALQKAALTNNYGYKADRWALAQSFSRARAARSTLMPLVNASGSASRRGSDSEKGFSVSNAFSGSFQASYELDIWGAKQDSVSAQEYGAVGNMYTWHVAGLTLESEVALTYFSYLAAWENLAVYDSMLRNAREVLAYQETRERLGTAAPLDVARQRSSVENMEASRLGYERSITEGRNNLCLLVGVSELPEDIASLMEKERLQDIIAASVEAGIPSDLLIRRPDIATAELRLKAANANIGVARAAFLPSFSLTASRGWQSDTLATLINPVNAMYSLGNSIAASIFDNGSNIARLDEAIASRNELIERYRQAVLAAFWEVSTALSAKEVLAKQEQHRTASAMQAAESLRIAQLRYKAGSEDFISVLTAQDSVLSSDNNLIQSRLERLNIAIALFKALGGGWGNQGNMDTMRKEFATAPRVTF